MAQIDPNRWGIIYVPKVGASNSQKRWLQIRDYLDFRQVKYDHVQSDKVESVERLTRMLIDYGYRTIVIAGGDESLNYAINGIMNALFPCSDSGVIQNIVYYIQKLFAGRFARNDCGGTKTFPNNLAATVVRAP